MGVQQQKPPVRTRVRRQLLELFLNELHSLGVPTIAAIVAVEQHHRLAVSGGGLGILLGSKSGGGPLNEGAHLENAFFEQVPVDVFLAVACAGDLAERHVDHLHPRVLIELVGQHAVAQDDRLRAGIAAAMLIDGEDADGIAGEKHLAENQEVRLVLDDEISPTIDCGFLGLLDFVPRPEVELERVAQQHRTKAALALECLEYAPGVRILAVVLVEFGHQNRELGLVRGGARLAPLAAELGDVASHRLGQVVQAGGDITGSGCRRCRAPTRRDA